MDNQSKVIGEQRATVPSELWLNCTYQQIGGPNPKWITTCIRFPVQRDSIEASPCDNTSSIGIDSIDQKFLLERQQVVQLLSSSPKFRQLESNKLKIFVIDNKPNTSQPFAYQQTIPLTDRLIIERCVDPESSEDPWIIELLLQIDEDSAQTLRQEGIQQQDQQLNSYILNKAQSQQININGQLSPLKSILKNQNEMRIIQSENEEGKDYQDFSLETQIKKKVSINPEFIEQTPESTIVSDSLQNQLSQEESKNFISHAQSLSKVESYKSNPTEDDIEREVRKRIKEMKKPKKESKISNRLNASFGIIPGLSVQETEKINQLIEIQKESNTYMNDSFGQQDKSIDMVFMYSEPLVFKEVRGKKTEYLKSKLQELEFKKEYDMIKKTIQKHGISFSIVKQNATTETLKERIEQGVKILHFNCHGQYGENIKSSKLKFEDQVEIGVLQDVGAYEISSIFEDIPQGKIKVVLLAACHSENIANMIKKKLPNSFIIAVYNSLPILDKAGRIFAEKFYDKLLEGESPKKSFDEAKKKVRRSERTYVCCCQHQHIHTKTCPLKQKIDQNISLYKQMGGLNKFQAETLAIQDSCFFHDADRISQEKKIPEDLFEKIEVLNKIEGLNFKEQIPVCTCGDENQQKNIHNDGCLFYEHFYENYQDQISRKNKTPKHVCCCQEQSFPHNEEEKFIIVESQDEQQREQDKINQEISLYKEFSSGILVDQQENSEFLKISDLSHAEDPMLLYDRNLDIFHVVKFLTDSSQIKDKVLSLYGENDQGLIQIALFAAQYCLERDKILLAFKIDLSKFSIRIIRKFFDDLNIIFKLEVQNQRNYKIYQQQILEKLNERNEKENKQIVLIIENLNCIDEQLQDTIEILSSEKNKRIKVILGEMTIVSQFENIKKREVQYLPKNQQNLIKSIANQKGLEFDRVFKNEDQLKEKVFQQLKNNFQIIKFIDKFQELENKEIHPDYEQIILKSLTETQQKDQNNSSPNSLNKSNSKADSNKNCNDQLNRCITCQNALDGEDQSALEGENSVEKDKSTRDKNNQEDYKIIEKLDIKISSQNPLIQKFRDDNKFDFKFKVYYEKFMKYNKNRNLEKTEFKRIDGEYEGEVRQHSRIKHGRGIYIEKSQTDNQEVSIYEGWRINDKRELYGRLIDMYGLVYEGEFKNNQPHGEGKMYQIEGFEKAIYPDGLKFEGKFFKGNRQELGKLTIPTHQLTYFGYFNNNKMDDSVFRIIKDDGDLNLEFLQDNKIQPNFKKISAYVFKDQMCAFVPRLKNSNLNFQISKKTFRQNMMLQQKDYNYVIMDIQYKSQDMAKFNFASSWLQYLALGSNGSQQNIGLIHEIILGYHPQYEFLFANLLQTIRKSLNIVADDKFMSQNQWKSSSDFACCFIDVKNIFHQSEGGDWEVNYIKENNQLVKKIFESTSNTLKDIQSMHDKNHQIRSTWEKILNKLLIDQQSQTNFLDQVCPIEEEQSLSQTNSDPQSTDLCATSSNEDQDIDSKLPLSVKNARALRIRYLESEKRAIFIKEFINLQRLVDEEISCDSTYQVKSVDDIIEALLPKEEIGGEMQQIQNNLQSYRSTLGKAFLEMCLAVHFIEDNSKDRVQEFMKNDVPLLFQKSGYLEIALSQQKFFNEKQHGFKKWVEAEDKTIEDYLEIKSLRGSIKNQSIDQKIFKEISDLIGCECNQDAIIDEVLKKLDLEIKQMKKQEIDEFIPQQVSLDVFFQFLGAIAQLLDPELAFKFLMTMLKRVFLQEQKDQKSNEDDKKYNQKMKNLYKFRKMQELEKYIEYQFIDKTILVQSLIHHSYSTDIKHKKLEEIGQSTLKFVLLRQILIDCQDLSIIEKEFNNNILDSLKAPHLTVIGTLLGLQKKLIYSKKDQQGNDTKFDQDEFQTIINIFQMISEVKYKEDDFAEMINYSLNTLKELKPKDYKNVKTLLDSTFFKFIGAVTLDSKLNSKIYNSFCTLLPYIYIEKQQEGKCQSFLKQVCIEIYSQCIYTIPFPKIFRVSKDAFKAQTFSMYDSFDFPVKLLNIQEFTIEQIYVGLLKYVKELEYQGKSKLINIIFNDENQQTYSQYYTVHSHVILVCLRIEKETKKQGLLKEFITQMRNYKKQRLINEQRMLIELKQENSSLTLAQKIQILTNLYSAQFKTTEQDIEKLNQPPTLQEAMDYVNNLNVKKEKTYDSLIYTYSYIVGQGIAQEILNEQNHYLNQDLHFIKQPLLLSLDTEQEGDQQQQNTHAIVQKNKKYILNNMLDNQLIQLSHFIKNRLGNSSYSKLQEIIILDEEQLRIVDYMALRQDSLSIDSIKDPVQVLSLLFQLLNIIHESIFDFGIYHGNIKPDRIKVSPSGQDGFVYSGNLLIIQPDHAVNRVIFQEQIEQQDVQQTVPPEKYPMYLIEKYSPGYCTKECVQAIKQEQKVDKTFLYNEEFFQVIISIQLIIQNVKKNFDQPNLAKARQILDQINSFILEEKKIMKEQKRTIFDLQRKISEDQTLAIRSISLFRACLTPTFSRNLWVYLENLSPLDPKLQALVFKWKRSRNVPVDLEKLITRKAPVKQDSEEQINTDSQIQNDEVIVDEQKMSNLRKLHLAFIEDWWFEIAQEMASNSQRKSEIDDNELEYVKNMIQSSNKGGIRVKLEWLKLKISILEYFEALRKIKSQSQSKQEEEKEENVMAPEVLRSNILGKIEQFNENESQKSNDIDQDLSLQKLESVKSYNSQGSSQVDADDELLGQDQLRHFVKAAIFPLNEVHIKIIQQYGKECLVEYMTFVITAMKRIDKESFLKKMAEKLEEVATHSHIIKKILEESQEQSIQKSQ